MENKEDYVIVNKHEIHDSCEKGIKNGWELILYCKICSMAKQSGFCNATNKYFADFLHTSERNIQKYLSDLKAKGFIKNYEVKIGSHTESRKIYPQITKGNIEIYSDCNGQPTNSWTPDPRTNEQGTDEQIDRGGVNSCTPTHEQLGSDPRTNRLRPTNKQVVTHEQLDTQVIDSNSIVIENNKDASAVSSLGVADAPSRFAPQHTYTESDIRELKFDGKVPDVDMPDIIQRQYNNLMSLVSNGDMDIEDVKDNMIQEFTTGFYGCNREPISIYVDYLITHNGLTEK